MAMTEKQQQERRLHVCKNKWVRRIAGVKIIDKRRMEELRVEVGVKESLTRKLVWSRLRWAGHVERMEGVRLTKRADALGVEGRRRRGRPRLRWEDYVKSDSVGVGGWSRRTRDRGEWRRLVETVVKRNKLGRRNGNINRRSVSVRASPRTPGKRRRATAYKTWTN